MASTKYTIKLAGEAQEKTFSKKAQAVEAADKLRASTRQGVTVETESGTVVHDLPGVRPMKRTPQYSRTVDLPEDAVVPEGLRVAYTRGRKNLAITHNPEASEDEGAYGVINFVTGEVLASGLPTTRDAGAFCKTVETPAPAAV